MFKNKPLIPVMWEAETGDLCEFEIILVYRFPGQPGYTEKRCLKKPKQKVKPKLTKISFDIKYSNVHLSIVN